MNTNWERLIRLLLPIRLRKAGAMIGLLKGLTAYTRRKYDQEYVWILNKIEELKYTSQAKLFEILLRDKFSQKIEIIDAVEGNVSYVKENEIDGSITLCTEEENMLLAVPMHQTTVGVDFVIMIPQSVDRDKVKRFVDMYIFMGITYRIEYIIE